MEKAEIIKVGLYVVAVVCVVLGVCVVGAAPHHQGEKEVIVKLVTVAEGFFFAALFAGVAATLISWKQEATADKRFYQALNK